MKYLETYLKTIEGRGNKQLADSIRKTVDNIAPKYLEEFSFCEHEVGLLFGNVQSGKTGQMFGVISVAADISKEDAIIAAKAEIENTLDTINQAFTELLNNLFQDAVLDATTDAQVLKTMLAREGLMNQMDFTAAGSDSGF